MEKVLTFWGFFRFFKVFVRLHPLIYPLVQVFRIQVFFKRAYSPVFFIILDRRHLVELGKCANCSGKRKVSIISGCCFQHYHCLCGKFWYWKLLQAQIWTHVKQEPWNWDLEQCQRTVQCGLQCVISLKFSAFVNFHKNGEKMNKKLKKNEKNKS